MSARPAMITALDSDAAIAAHLANFVAFWSMYGKGPQGALQVSDGTTFFSSGVPHPLFNGVLRAQLRPDQVDATITAVTGQLGARHVPGFWWVGPGTAPADLGAHLLRRGFFLAGRTPGMAADLNAMNRELPRPAGLRIVEVTDPALVPTYLSVAATGSDIPAPMQTALLHAEQATTPEPGASFHRFLAYLDDKPVATSALILYAGVAGIFVVATLAEARRKGIGSAITTYALEYARTQGYRVAMLQASEMGFPIYQKIGFRTVFSFDLYMWAGGR